MQGLNSIADENIAKYLRGRFSETGHDVFHIPFRKSTIMPVYVVAYH